MRSCSVRLVLAIMLAFMVSACAAGISKQNRSRVSFAGDFAELLQQPERYTGEIVILGGKVIETRVAEGVSELVVLQLALDRSDRPMDGDQSRGRYLVQSRGFLDPVLYPPGALITVVGRAAGGRAGAIGQMTYIYPLIDLIEIKKWTPREAQSPRFHFGIGVGTRF